MQRATRRVIGTCLEGQIERMYIEEAVSKSDDKEDSGWGEEGNGEGR